MVKSALLSPRWIAAALAAFLVIAIGASGARADVFQFTSANAGILGNGTVSSPYANGTVTESGGVVTFSLDVAGNPAKFGDFGFNIASGVSVSNLIITSSSGGDSSGWSLDTSGGNMDGFGSFAKIVGPPNSSNADRLSALTFTLNASGGSGTAADFEVLNASGNMFALEYFPTSGGTGFVGTNSAGGGGGGGDVVVPEPTSLALSAIGCVALLGLWSVRRWKAVAA